MRILCISPRATIGGLEALRSGNQLIQGIIYVAAAAKRAGHQVQVDFGGLDDIEIKIRQYNPEVVGISCVTATYPMTREIIRKIKGLFPDIKTIIGGHHATFMYREVINESGVDYVCRGEGEEVFPLLLDSLTKGDLYPAIPGIVFYKDGHFHNDETIALLTEIDTLPAITPDLLAPGLKFSPKLVSSRGCPFKCSFCSISAFYNGKFRQRKAEDVIADIERFVGWGYNNFWFHDDTLTANVKWVRDFCNQVIDRGFKITWNCMSRVDTICRDPGLVALMAKAGCRLMSIGIESGIPEIIERMHKKIDHEQIRQAIQILNKTKISHNWFMIIGSGDEFDTHDYIQKNIRFFCSFKFGLVLVSVLTPFPGTEIYDKLLAENRILHYDWEKYDIMHCVYQPLGMSPKELESYLKKAYFRIYWSMGLRIIPVICHAIRSGALSREKISRIIKVFWRTYILRKPFEKAISKMD